MYAWPWIDKKIYNDYGAHNLLDRPRDKPFRTGVGVAGIIFFTVETLACATDLLANNLHIAFERLIEILQIGVLVGPIVGLHHRLQGLQGPRCAPTPTRSRSRWAASSSAPRTAPTTPSVTTTPAMATATTATWLTSRRSRSRRLRPPRANPPRCQRARRRRSRDRRVGRPTRGPRRGSALFHPFCTVA